MNKKLVDDMIEPEDEEDFDKVDIKHNMSTRESTEPYEADSHLYKKVSQDYFKIKVTDPLLSRDIKRKDNLKLTVEGPKNIQHLSRKSSTPQGSKNKFLFDFKKKRSTKGFKTAKISLGNLKPEESYKQDED
jgi:hypothetical protein